MESPIQVLLNYLNTEIYSKMSKKDKEELFKNRPLDGSLVQAINIYSQSLVLESREELRATHNREIESLKTEIERLRDGKQSEYDQRYPMGRNSAID